MTLGRTSSIAITFQYNISLLNDKESHTGTVCLVDDDIPVFKRVGNSPDKTLSPFRGRVDGDKAKGSFGGGHGEDWMRYSAKLILSNSSAFKPSAKVKLNCFYPPSDIPTPLSGFVCGDIGIGPSI